MSSLLFKTPSMQKVYLLLRSNKQTGPYSLEELLQLNLKPFDLVWVQGRSAAWQYPSEIPSLKPFVPETPQTNAPFQPIATSAMEEKFSQPENSNSYSQPEPLPQSPVPQKNDVTKRVFVSVPKSYNTANQKNYSEQSAFAPKPQPVDERKEEVKTSAASYSQSTPSYAQKKAAEEEVHTNYSRSINDVEEDYTNWVYRQKTKKKASVNPKELVLAALILAVIGGGYYVMSKPSVANSVLPANKVTTQPNQQPAASALKETTQEETVSSQQNSVPGSNDISVVNEPKTKTIKTKNPVAVSKTETNSSVPSVQNPMPVEKTNPNIHDNNKDIVVNEPERKQEPKENTSTEKKKKIGDVLKGIFSKKEKKEEPKGNETVLEDPKPANNRQATRREDDSNPSNDSPASPEISTASLMEQVDISSNAPDNWMMGVKNLKVTLKNRSNVTIQAASVAVNYYDENNQLLEKKLVYFSNIAPKAKATVAAPDHKFADHVDLRITSATAKEDRYARY
jgi:hypothetical protein